ncbi:MAG: hypothetical protein ACYC0M_15645 [Burkholderiales bacterium]
MFIYKPEQPSEHTVFIQPGKNVRCSDWLDEDNNPRMFRVHFHNGRAEVPDNLGNYMVDTGQARISPIILPG